MKIQQILSFASIPFRQVGFQNFAIYTISDIMMHTRFFLPIVILMLIMIPVAVLQAQEQERVEPELADAVAPLSYLDFDIRNGAGFRIQLNNFGFAIGGEYHRVLSRNTKGLIELQITNVRDENEQTFQNFWGYTVIPNKYNRIMAFPVNLGVQRRLFANQLSDNFRLFMHLSGGPSPAYVYPYFDDSRGYGFRLQGQQNYDQFQGWGEGEFILGASGQISIGANTGGDFGNLQSVRIGYHFQYFPDGVQVMEPNRPNFEYFDPNPWLDPADQHPDAILPAASKQFFFGTPHITFVFGSMW